MALTLYCGTKRFSSWSLRPYTALVHAGADFTVKMVKLRQQDSRATISAVSPSGRVPVLYDGDLIVYDSLAICEYTAELFPLANLWPDDRADRARARSIAAEMHSGFVALRNAMSMDLAADLPGQGRTPECLADIERISEVWSTCLAASGGPFLFGTFTIADAMHAPVVTRFKTYGVELPADLQTYCETVLALPAMKQWYADALQDSPLEP